MLQKQIFMPHRQRLALLALAENPAQFLNSAEGLAFIEQLELFFAPAATGVASSWGYQLEKAEVVNIIITRLLQADGYLIGYVAAAYNPWGYLTNCLKNWVQEEYGLRGKTDTGLDTLQNRHLSGKEADDDYSFLVQEALDLTFNFLEKRTPKFLVEELKHLLEFLVSNPPARLSYESSEIRWMSEQAPSFTVPQLREVMILIWGSRPKRWETSVLGQYAKNPDFDPMASGTHARAINRYKQAMAVTV